MESLIANRNKLQNESLDLVSASPESEIFEQATRSITNYIKQTAVEVAITEALKDLTEQLTLLRPKIPTSVEQLDIVISNFLQQLKAVEARKQQEISAQALEAVSNYLEQEAVEEALNSQFLDNLSNQLSQLANPNLSTAMQQLEVIVANRHANLQAQAAEPVAAEGEQIASNQVIAKSPDLLAAQFQILTDQIFAPEAVYQEQDLRLERSQGKITASIQGREVDLHKPENLAIIVNHLQTLVNEEQLLSLYEEFQTAARLEKSITNQAAFIVQLNSGNYHSLGLAVEITGSSIEIKLDQESVFKSHLGKVQRPDDLLQLSNLELQLQGTITDLQQTIAAKLKLEEARLLAERLQAQTQAASKSVIETQQKGQGHGLAL